MGKRILATIIDFGLIFGPVFIIGFFLDIFESVIFLSVYGKIIIALFLVMFLLVPVELICKDIVGKRSVGKKIKGLKILSIDGKEPTYKQLLIRNIFMLWAPIEVIIVLFFDKPRLGDKIAKTKVVEL
ncbi:MAG: RDD family protein [Clostridia bacterium]|nr:RDD family protein [Clostridia bacterium]